jgi:hypothetical protein
MIKSILSIAFILLTYVNFYAIFLLFSNTQFSQWSLWFLAGATSAFVCCHFRWRFTPIYIIAHELAHWLAAKLCFRKTGKFRVGLKGGYVEIENANTFIFLAPYFFPTLSVLWIPIWLTINYFYPSEYNTIVFFMLLGSSYAHHIYMTVLLTLTTKQTDFDKPGHFHSACIIFFTNTAVIFTLLNLFSKDLSNFKFWIQALQTNYELIQKLIQFAQQNI